MSDRPDTIADAAVEDWPLFRLVAESGRRNAAYVVVGVVGMVLAQALSTADMFVIGVAFDAMFNGQAYALPLVPAGWIPPEPVGMLVFTAVLLASLKAIDVAAAVTAHFCWNLLAQRVQHDVRVEAFDTVQRLGMHFFDGQQTGDVMSVLNNDVNRLEEFFTNGPNAVVYATTVIVSSFVYMALLNWRLALVAAVLAPAVAVVNWWFGRRHERRHDAVREETGRLNAALETVISGIPVVKAYGGEGRETDRVAGRSREHRTAIWRSHLVRARHQPSLRLLAGLGFLLTFAVGTQWVLDGRFWFLSGTITAGELIPFLYYTQNLVGPMRALARVTGFYEESRAAAKRVAGVQRAEPSREDADERTPSSPDSPSSREDAAGARSSEPPSAGAPGDAELTAVAGRVEYDGVSFGYPGTDERVLDGVDVAVEPGQTVGLVGSTGAGKSTLTKLLLRFYDPDEGAVRVDGRDVRDVSLSSLRAAVGYVEQDPFLFAGTVRENVAYGVEDATDDEVVAAAKRAGAHRFITELDGGYDAAVGERGTKLSGGQRQRIALARVLLTDPPILVLDEATSQVDNRTEALLQRSLAAVTADRTTIVVAHRLSTVRDADLILVLDDGEVVERGTHEELLDADGRYADLWRVQVGVTGD
ncbi:ABC transporter ATP-binding protein [Halomicrobium salinisoli]|uniref:ABC transporter ATP-binding protein n=1 Tax=Halomicrobium salinisoli TaxID=2878391 RepID=UPI001CF02B73|nr:ABC transporter ATP-binding protein [Halomicrobium salinisoli]